MRRTDALIAERLAAWGDVPHAIPEVFPDPTPGAIGAAVDAWCRRALGAEPVPPGSARGFVAAHAEASLAGQRGRLIRRPATTDATRSASPLPIA